MYNRDKIISTMRNIAEESKDIKPYVIIAQPRRDKSETPAQRFNSNAGCQVDLSGYTYHYLDISGEKVDVARNYLMDLSLYSGAKYLFFIGEDTVVPWYAFQKLHETAENNPNSITVGVYYFKTSNPMIMVKDKNGYVVPGDVTPGQVYETWQTGMDCMLIPISVLEQLKNDDPELPYCCIGYKIEDLPFVGEDNFFAFRTRQLGIKTLVNTDVQCLHIDLATGKYTAHPSVNINDYMTEIPITEPLTIEDRQYLEKRWTDRLPEGSNTIKSLIQQKIQNNENIILNFHTESNKIENAINLNVLSDSQLKNIFTLDENSVDEIYISHSLSFIPKEYVDDIFKKLFEILKINGKLYIEELDFDKLCQEFCESSYEDKEFLLHIMYESLIGDNITKRVTGFFPDKVKNILMDYPYKVINQIDIDMDLIPGTAFKIEAIK